ncbi:sigma-70 family RNA polymerase sigma factor [Roseospira marina]|uniref:Sigma-70 family RNA polymerase sigma factor n=1 Tax=Roseospira marina TaxID=140057 RepID=A0A5M6ICI5_9PROT|nr:sigma-70 family RNA polymerase sigma factor [Roseospira marina]KAA5605984.1 sigma-70 family RNA polymerase sigma factor [Roseospira marina]MBB4313165.1 RNA polymerase sigma-70 factor (ECF subfamily) [Roseospira marina]MBB5086094.1 RNA polymerase sigma-70 factor (ECF subfamily) [Roseospira marina]
MSSFNQELIEALPHMRAFAHSLTNDRALADDLAQEAATRALANKDAYQAGTNFRGWVFTILRNAFYSEHRRKWRKSEQSDEEAMLAFGEPSGQHAQLELDDFKRAFAHLPHEQREAMVLVGACGFEYEQAAEIVGCAPGTIKSRVSRGRRDVKAYLDGNALTEPRGAAARSPKQRRMMAEFDRQVGLGAG